MAFQQQRVEESEISQIEQIWDQNKDEKKPPHTVVVVSGHCRTDEGLAETPENRSSVRRPFSRRLHNES